VLNGAFFNEFAVILPRDARAVVREMADHGVLGGVSLGRLYPGEAGLDRALLVTATEMTTEADIHALVAVLGDLVADAHQGSPT
jgi:glycine dehydrogenase subunit 1